MRTCVHVCVCASANACVRAYMRASLCAAKLKELAVARNLGEVEVKVGERDRGGDVKPEAEQEEVSVRWESGSWRKGISSEFQANFKRISSEFHKRVGNGSRDGGGGGRSLPEAHWGRNVSPGDDGEAVDVAAGLVESDEEGEDDFDLCGRRCVRICACARSLWCVFAIILVNSSARKTKNYRTAMRKGVWVQVKGRRELGMASCAQSTLMHET